VDREEELRALCATAARGGDPGEIRILLYAFYRWCANAQIPELSTLAETAADVSAIRPAAVPACPPARSA